MTDFGPATTPEPSVPALLLPRVAGRLTYRMLAMLLVSQAIVIFFGALVARGLAGNDDQAGFIAMSMLAVLSLLASGVQKRPHGVALGWVVQILTLACTILVPMMLLISLIFGGMWVAFLIKGGRADHAHPGAPAAR